ncbi:uncharacterized protein LOC100377505 [Saccoglossus kowalevskii]|uniref:Axoneme-associated protein mst101(2)-like n=1 Tax=Saccoglossus kowalevskii TaxID=10224 RepID=A0ABM0LV26_SACKO|nr:PREDICTED: axoneme-associated protein mst101(2)-like [Saccoglossus kowalevskii]
MRKIKLNAHDIGLFATEIGGSEYYFFKKHTETFKRMWEDQGRIFWERFILCLRGFSINYGVLKEFPVKSEQYEVFIDDAFEFLKHEFVKGKVNTAKSLVLDTAILAQNKHSLGGLESSSYSKDPFYHKDTRDVFRRFFGDPKEKTSYIKVYLLLPLYLCFGGSICNCLRAWLDANIMSPGEDYYTPPTEEDLRPKWSKKDQKSNTVAELMHLASPNQSYRVISDKEEEKLILTFLYEQNKRREMGADTFKDLDEYKRNLYEKRMDSEGKISQYVDPKGDGTLIDLSRATEPWWRDTKPEGGKSAKRVKKKKKHKVVVTQQQKINFESPNDSGISLCVGTTKREGRENAEEDQKYTKLGARPKDKDNSPTRNGDSTPPSDGNSSNGNVNKKKSKQKMKRKITEENEDSSNEKEQKEQSEKVESSEMTLEEYLKQAKKKREIELAAAVQDVKIKKEVEEQRKLKKKNLHLKEGVYTPEEDLYMKRRHVEEFYKWWAKSEDEDILEIKRREEEEKEAKRKAIQKEINALMRESMKSEKKEYTMLGSKKEEDNLKTQIDAAQKALEDRENGLDVDVPEIAIRMDGGCSDDLRLCRGTTIDQQEEDFMPRLERAVSETFKKFGAATVRVVRPGDPEYEDALINTIGKGQRNHMHPDPELCPCCREQEDASVFRKRLIKQIEKEIEDLEQEILSQNAKRLDGEKVDEDALDKKKKDLKMKREQSDKFKNKYGKDISKGQNLKTSENSKDKDDEEIEKEMLRRLLMERTSLSSSSYPTKLPTLIFQSKTKIPENYFTSKGSTMQANKKPGVDEKSKVEPEVVKKSKVRVEPEVNENKKVEPGVDENNKEETGVNENNEVETDDPVAGRVKEIVDSVATRGKTSNLKGKAIKNLVVQRSSGVLSDKSGEGIFTDSNWREKLEATGSHLKHDGSFEPIRVEARDFAKWFDKEVQRSEEEINSRPYLVCVFTEDEEKNGTMNDVMKQLHKLKEEAQRTGGLSTDGVSKLIESGVKICGPRMKGNVPPDETDEELNAMMSKRAEIRKIEEEMRREDEEIERRRAGGAKKDTGADTTTVNNSKLKKCSGCGTVEAYLKNYKKCQKCREQNVKQPRYYCSRICQVKDWTDRHKKEHKLWIKSGGNPM